MGLWLGISVISCIEFLVLIILLICYCITRPQDAYRLEFDSAERERQKAHEKRMEEFHEQFSGKKANSPNSKEIYRADKHMTLPPKIQEPN